MAAVPWTATAEGLRLHVRLTPGAKAERLDGVAVLDDGTCTLKIRVAAPPVEGKANAALVKLLARNLKQAKGDIVLLAGAGSRRKTLLLRGEAEALERRLAACLDTPSVPGGR